MVYVSKMTGKLTGIAGINTNPLSNQFCKTMSKRQNSICNKCYSCKMLHTSRISCIPCFERNSVELSTNNIEIPKIKDKFSNVRFHAHGELINEQHFKNFIKIATAYPNKTFTLFTKRVAIVSNVLNKIDKPNNLIIVYSNPIIDKPMLDIPTHFDKVFNVVTNTTNFKINCGAKSCATCLNCFDKNKDSIIIEKLK